MDVLKSPVLVLNKVWTPIDMVSLQDAIPKLFSTHNDGTPKAKIIDPTSFETFTWDDWSQVKPLLTDSVIRSSNVAFKVPEVIIYTKFDKFPQPKATCSRRNLFKRDHYRCQYCKKQPGTEELTIDHILPRSRGGETSWTNCVLSCIDCNARKANRTPDEAGMSFLKKPIKPSAHLFQFDKSIRLESWKQFLSDVYWNIELEP